MRPYCLGLCVLLIASSTWAQNIPVGRSRSNPAPRPNIIVILSDDMGFSDLGCYGGEIKTPHLDRLAGQGLRFCQFYNAARCCPTRASILTGLYPHQAGVGYMTERLGSTPSYQGFLRKDRKTIAEMLGPAGYTTLHVGKWHVGGEKNGTTPPLRGFERSWRPAGKVNYWENVKCYEDGKLQNFSENEGRYLTDITTDKAIEFIDYATQKSKPFFMYLAFNAAHWPLHAKPGDIAQYRGKYLRGWDELRRQRIHRLDRLGLVKYKHPYDTQNPSVPTWNSLPRGDAYAGFHAMTSKQHDQDDWDAKMAVYAAQITSMDANIGRILAFLKESGQYDDTLIMYLQDNGGCAEGIGKNEAIVPGGPDSYNAYHLPWATLSNTPFRMYKHFVHEGGIATPFIAHWPAGIPEQRRGQIEKQSFGHLIDIVPTCLELAGVHSSKLGYPLEGQSLVRVIKDEVENDQRTLCWEHEGNRAIRKGAWKLVSRYQDDIRYFQAWKFPTDARSLEWELYNIVEDRWELNELSQSYPEIVASLKDDYQEYYERIGALPRKEVIKGSKYEY